MVKVKKIKLCINSDYLCCLLNARIKKDQTISEMIKCTNYRIFTKIEEKEENEEFQQHSYIYWQEIKKDTVHWMRLDLICLFMNEWMNEWMPQTVTL